MGPGHLHKFAGRSHLQEFNTVIFFYEYRFEKLIQNMCICCQGSFSDH